MPRSVSLLLFSLILFLTGHGVQLSLLPLHASGLGWTEFEIGLTGSAYFLGFIVGCLTVSKMLATAGYIRVFLCFASLAACVLLLLETTTSLLIWILLRFITGWCLAAIYATTESWLNEHSENQNRGKILSIYVVVTLVGMSMGQILLGLIPMEELFMIGALIMLIAILPIGLFCEESKVAITGVSPGFVKLKELSRLAVAGVLIGGIVTGSIWTLAPVMGEARGLSNAGIGIMMNAIILGGALLQLPIGLVSDWLGRPVTVLGVSLLSICSAGALFFVSDGSTGIQLFLVFLFGGGTLTLYAVCAAEAHDHSTLSRVETSALLLLVSGLGSIVGPVVVGWLLQYTADALLIVSGLSMLLLVIYGVIYASPREAVIIRFHTQDPILVDPEVATRAA
jgi:MFS family permease